MDSIYITLIGNAVIANRTESAHIVEVHSVVKGEIEQKLRDVNHNGEMRYSIRVRSVMAELGK